MNNKEKTHKSRERNLYYKEKTTSSWYTLHLTPINRELSYVYKGGAQKMTKENGENEDGSGFRALLTLMLAAGFWFSFSSLKALSFYL